MEAAFEDEMETTSFSTGARPLKLHQGRADVREVPTAQTLGMLARKVLSSSTAAPSRNPSMSAI